MTTALLDANVLVPTVLRALLFEVADAGLFAPRWTDRIEGEWRAAALKGAEAPAGRGRGREMGREMGRGRDPGAGAPPPEALVDGDLALARARFPQARVDDWERHEGPLSLPDWSDRHVLAGAIAAGAPLLITNNLRDFPRRALAAHGVTAEAPDPLLWRWLGEQETPMRAALEAFARQRPPHLADQPLPALLKRARLPRLAKAVGRL